MFLRGKNIKVTAAEDIWLALDVYMNLGDATFIIK
jgi:hypothetical protein